MKKIRDKIEHHIWCADRKWKALPEKRQRYFTKLFFTGYAVLTLLVLVSVVISTGNKTNTMLIDHIRTISDRSSVEKVANDNHTNVPLKK
ncbi:hypothetical protein NG800_013825 [Epilithonimonas ginsengisoli]|uniref:Nitrogen regulatory IIA protein n=1 Tax=Epilithonimonas ginsengisoli TaxID=1245592 RepID=A0ABU4JKA3_9FLAO|nr:MULTISPECIES: hypothetical protein [Chryseobacterium group]MBV6880481.1 hypothetical protein [Epilithonimonas sp. FP105]MDW8549999.1 hypothetical protein [Epilithonimonas ginsengisoli]OAH69185.1 hypothetical protein AXA65_15265 [Chryseobacterium sp. FP211-J200]